MKLFILWFAMATFLSCGGKHDLSYESMSLEQRKNGTVRKKGKKLKTNCQADIKCYKKCWKGCYHVFKHEEKSCHKINKECLKESGKLYSDWIKTLEVALQACVDNATSPANLEACLNNTLNNDPNKPTVTPDSCWTDYCNCLDTPMQAFNDCMLLCPYDE